MARDLKLEVVLAAIDKATKPIRAITQGSVGLARTMKATRDTLKGLQSQQKDVSSFKALKGANDQTQQAMKASTDRVKQLSKQLASTTNPTKALNNEFKRAVRESQALKQKHGEQQRTLQGLRTKLGQAGISTKNLGQHERDLRQKIVSTNQSLTQQEGRLKRVTSQQQRLAKAKASYEKSQQLAGSMAASGAAGMAAGGGILYAGARMMAPGVQFDADMAKVQALTRLDRNDDQLAAMRAQARQLGADTMFSATEAAQGQGFLAMAGFDPKAVMDAMPGMLDIAKAGDAGLAETADIVSNVLTGMNMKASETGRLGDVLVGAFTRSNTNLQMLGETMKYVGPIASSVGQDVETMAAMAGKLGDAGIQGSMGGTALRAIINRLSAPPKAAAKALDELGVSAKDADGNMRNLPEVLTEIYAKTKDMGDADRAGLLKGIAGEEAVSALQVLVKQAGTGSLQDFIATLREAQGEAAATAKVMGDNLVGDLDELSSAWDNLGIELQTQQNGPLREIVQMFAEIVGGITTWVEKNPELAGTIVKVVAGLAALVAAGGALTVMLASILGPLAMIKYGFAMASVAAGAFSMPVLAVIAAIALLGIAAWMLWRNWDGVVGGLKALWADMVAVAHSAFNALLTFFNGIWSEIKTAFDGGILGISTLIINWSPLGLFYKAFAGVMSYFGVDLPGKFTEFGGMLMSGLVTGIKNGLGAVKNAVTGAGDQAIGWFKDKLGIRSPSRVFAALGDDTMAGLQAGLDRSQDGPLASILKAGKAMAGAGALALGIGGAGQALAVDGRPPLQSGSAPVVVQGDTITIQLTAPAGTDSAELERMINRVMDRRERGKAARIRSALYDNE
ncbi:phage tail tape measure protein [Halopseudomonas bauzanensis]|uniref:phage tail tape measure protein n=1 Tax=Halopseudomonas bauzanensis TaxID=653930 RepID=UPI0035233EBC